MPTAKPLKKNTDSTVRLYIRNPALIEVFDALARLRGISRSEAFARLAKSLVRSNAPRLRKAGVKVTEEVFA